MSQQSQQQFVEILSKNENFEKYFNKVIVLDVGSLDVNGNNKQYFTDCEYIGIDVGEGKNVNIISFAHEFEPFALFRYDQYFASEFADKITDGFLNNQEKGLDQIFDTIISTEAFEHDPYLDKTLNHIVNDLLNPGGLFVFTCASGDQPEHGTERTSPQDCPLMIAKGHNYYKNIFESDIREILNIEEIFTEFQFINVWRGLQFWGIKK